MRRQNETLEKDSDLELDDIRLEVADDVREIGQKVITQENLKFMNARIGYVKVWPHVSKTVLARCIKTNKELRFFSSHDYIVEVSADVWSKLTEELKYILVYHELLHIDITSGKSGEEKYNLRDHTVKDFHSIIRKYGMNWFEGIKSTAATVLELDGIAIDKLKL